MTDNATLCPVCGKELISLCKTSIPPIYESYCPNCQYSRRESSNEVGIVKLVTGMPDRELVMRGLEACHVEDGGCVTLCRDNGCPYNGSHPHCMTKLHEDALALLKEPPVSEVYFDADGALHFTVKGFPENEPPQKYVPSIGGAREFGTVSSHWYRCGFPECGFPIDRGDIYCRHCGRPITWEEPGKPEPPKGEDDEGC